MPEDNRLEADPTQRVSRWLAELPDAPAPATKREIVARLASDIRSARSKGYTLKAIARHLQDRGFDINYNTLRDALPRQKKSRPGKKKPRAAAMSDGARTSRDGLGTDRDAPMTGRDGLGTDRDAPMTGRDGARMRAVAPSDERLAASAGPAATSGGPAAPPRAPGEPGRVVFPPGASSVPAGDGRFIPAPDSDVL